MKIFKKPKTALNSVSMSYLIYESAKNMYSVVDELLNRIEYKGSKSNIEVNLYCINIELCRLSLYKGNDDRVVDDVIDKSYYNLLYDINENEITKNDCERIIDTIKEKFDRIFSQKNLLAPKERYIYRLFLEQLGIREDRLQNQAISDFIFYAKTWINNADMINQTYFIKDTEEDKQKNEQIDFRF